MSTWFALVGFVAFAFGFKWCALIAILSAVMLWIAQDRAKHANQPGRRPEGVRIIHPDGSETLCKVRDMGVDKHGSREWELDRQMGIGDRIDYDYWPCGTWLSAYTDDTVTGARWDGNRYRMEGHA